MIHKEICGQDKQIMGWIRWRFRPPNEECNLWTLKHPLTRHIRKHALIKKKLQFWRHTNHAILANIHYVPITWDIRKLDLLKNMASAIWMLYLQNMDSITGDIRKVAVTKAAAINMKMSPPLVTITLLLLFSLDDLGCLSPSTSLQVGMVKDTVLDLKDSVRKLLLSVYDSSSSHSTCTTHHPCSLSTILKSNSL